jgi:hypothetical protein
VDKGLVTVTGGKLATFRKIALDAISAATGTLGNLVPNEPDETVFSVPGMSAHDIGTADERWAQRLAGRYGACASKAWPWPYPSNTIDSGRITRQKIFRTSSLPNAFSFAHAALMA